MKMFIALGFAVLVGVAVAVPAAWADPPIIVKFPDSTNTAVVTDVCPQPFTLTYTTTKRTVTRFFDQNGVWIEGRVKFFEQDTFVGPTGNTLIGVKYSGDSRFLFDSNGNITAAYGTGQLEKVQLPDGSWFLSAGQVDFLAANSDFVFTVDTGHSGNVDGLCAALEAS